MVRQKQKQNCVLFLFLQILVPYGGKSVGHICILGLSVKTEGRICH